MNEHVRDLARQYTELAITTLAAIAGNPKEDARARVPACTAILDRAWGKPTASVHVSGGEDLLARVLALTPAQRAKRIAELQRRRDAK